jgi:hypothetical protein
MRKQEGLLKACIIFIALTLVTCIGFAYYTRLKEPVFLSYCIAVSAVQPPETGYQQPVLELQYLTNSYDQREVTGISFVEAPDYYFMATENASYYGNSFTYFSNNTTQKRGEIIGRYSLRRVYLYMNNYFLEDWKGEVELNNAMVSFSDGSTLRTDLGRIILYSDNAYDSAMTLMHSNSSNQGIAETIYRAEQNISDFKVESPLLKDASHKLELTFNCSFYDKIETLELKSGDKLTITNCEKDWPGKNDLYDEYDVRPMLTFTKEDGSRGSVRIYDMVQKKYFYGYLDVLKYLERRGGF